MSERFDLMQALVMVACTALLALAIVLALVITRQPLKDRNGMVDTLTHEAAHASAEASYAKRD